MSVYIKGMEMPTSCCECFAFKSNADGYLFCKAKRVAFGKEDAEWLPLKTPNWCPLIPVPDHGRLFDKDVMCNECRRVAEEYDGTYPDCTYCPAHLLPTIIPADQAEEG